MADIPAEPLRTITAVPASAEGAAARITLPVVGGIGGADTVLRYKMRAQDDGVPAPGFVTWVSVGPDFPGTGFSGGTPTPVGSMIPGSAVAISNW